jgi:hypothetical protein
VFVLAMKFNRDNKNNLYSLDSLSNAHHDPETDYFMNAKRKLRLVLSTSDCHACDVRNNSVGFEYNFKQFN